MKSILDKTFSCQSPLNVVRWTSHHPTPGLHQGSAVPHPHWTQLAECNRQFPVNTVQSISYIRHQVNLLKPSIHPSGVYAAYPLEFLGKLEPIWMSPGKRHPRHDTDPFRFKFTHMGNSEWPVDLMCMSLIVSTPELSCCEATVLNAAPPFHQIISHIPRWKCLHWYGFHFMDIYFKLRGDVTYVHMEVDLLTVCCVW